jgi:hypothetical protein
MFINYQQNALTDYCFEFLFLYSRITSANKMNNFSSSAIMKPKNQFYQLMLVGIA